MARTEAQKNADKAYEKKREARSKVWAGVVYPESAPQDWQDKLRELLIDAFISPLHDKDCNADGEVKKAHWHVMLMFGSMKTTAQAKEAFQSFGCTVEPQRVRNTRGMARYLCHMDNPDKYQYNQADVVAIGAADYLSAIGLPTDKYDILIQMPAGRVLDLSIAISVFAALVTVLLLGAQQRFSWGWAILIAIAVGVFMFPLPRLLLRSLRRRRLNKFNFQLEDALGIMSSALKAGFSINQALEEVAEQNQHPIAVEFRLLIQEIRLGVPLDQALDTMCRRLGSDDFELVATAITTARQTGGELTGTLDRVAGLIRERVRIANKVRAVTAMGRLQAVMIGAMPFVLMFGMSLVAPRMMDMFFSSRSISAKTCSIAFAPSQFRFSIFSGNSVISGATL